MSDLGAEERALLGALRTSDDPTDDDRARMRRVVWARLGIAGAAAITAGTGAQSATAATAIRLAGSAVDAGSAVGAGAAIEMGGSAVASAGVNAGAAAVKGAMLTLFGTPMKIGLTTLIVGLTSGAALYASARRGAPSSPETTRIESPAPQTLEIAAIASAPEQATAAPAARAPTPRTPGATGAAARPRPESLDAEIALLRDAQQALRAGQFARALSKLNEHAARYPKGMLSMEREASRAIALCRSGRGAVGRPLAAKLLAESPGSPLAARVRAACGQEE